MGNENFKYAYFALIKANIDNEYNEAMLQFILYVIKKKHYDEIDVEILCKDFEKIIGFVIPYFPMKKLLTEALKDGFIEYTKDKKYIPNFSNIDKSVFMNDINNENKKFTALLRDFKSFVLRTNNESLTDDDADKIISSFIEEQGMLLFNEKDNYFNSCHEEYLFAKYLEELYLKDSSQFEYINELIVGRLLSEYLLYTEDDKEYLSDVTVYLDTGFVFRLLGIDGLNRKEIYNQLLRQMQSLGMKIKVYEHTYSEISGIILNSIQWIDNLEYDPVMSSETIDYFVRNSYTKEYVEDYATNLRKTLNDLGVEIESMSYPQSVPQNVISEMDYYDAIVNQYKENNDDFDEEEKRNTIWMDAKSFFYTDYLSNGFIANSISDIKHLFVTTNFSLAFALKKLLSERKRINDYGIPFCVTDSFLGVVLWKTAPDKIADYTRNRLMVAMNAAFLPKEALLEKLVSSLEKCVDAGKISPEECYMLKTTHLAHKYLMDITKGDPELFTQQTPLEILQAIHNEGKEEGFQEGIQVEREKANKEIESISNKLDAKDKENQNLQRKDIDQQIVISELKKRIAIQDKSNAEENYASIEKHEKIAYNKAKKHKRNLGIIYIAFLIIYALVGVYFWTVSKKYDLFSLYTFLAPVVFAVITYAYFAITGKSFNIFKWTDNIVKQQQEKYFAKNNIKLEQKEQLSYTINELSKDIDKHNRTSEELLTKR